MTSNTYSLPLASSLKCQLRASKAFQAIEGPLTQAWAAKGPECECPPQVAFYELQRMDPSMKEELAALLGYQASDEQLSFILSEAAA